MSQYEDKIYITVSRGMDDFYEFSLCAADCDGLRFGNG